MSDPGIVLDAIAKDANDLDRLSKRIYAATATLDAAEKEWDERYDAIVEVLEEEYAEAGRKSVPEHSALSAARRAHRKEYVEWREAKRALERLQQQLSAKKAAMSGRQSELNALRDEARVQEYAGRNQAPQTFGRRAA